MIVLVISLLRPCSPGLKQRVWADACLDCRIPTPTQGRIDDCLLHVSSKAYEVVRQLLRKSEAIHHPHFCLHNSLEEVFLLDWSGIEQHLL